MAAVAPEDGLDDAWRPPSHRWTREEYYRLAETEVLGPWPHIELIDGEIIDQGQHLTPRHVAALQRLRRALAPLESESANLRIRGQLSLGPNERPSDPEPDGALVAGDAEDYWEAHPNTALLVIEVAEISRERDRGWKSSLYASFGIPEYWIVDIVSNVVEVRREPCGSPKARFLSDYAERIVYRPGDLISSLVDPAVEIAVASFFRMPDAQTKDVP